MQWQKLKSFIRDLTLSVTESDAPDWANSAERFVEQADLPDETLPTALSDPAVLNVSERRSAGILLKATDSGATYSVQVYGWASSPSTVGGTDMEDLYKLDEGLWEDLEGNTMLGIDCQLYEGIYVTVEALTAGDLCVEMFPIDYKA